MESGNYEYLGLTLNSARATSATPTLYKPLRSARTADSYLNKASFHNNPARVADCESKLIWPELEHHSPDILLSICTDQSKSTIDHLLSAMHSDSQRTPLRTSQTRTVSSVPSKRSAASRVKVVHGFYKTSIDNANLTWTRFLKGVPHTEADRYIEINPKMNNRTTEMDNKSQINILLEETRTFLSMHEVQTKIGNISRKLIASSFYFDKAGLSRGAEGQIIVKGSLWHLKTSQ